jgi:aminopeptidase-like protein
MSDREIMNAKGFAVMDNDERVFRDPVVKRVVDKFKERSDAGYAKYGTTLDEERTTNMKYLIDIQEELMDAILYIQTAQEELKEFLDEKET